MLDCLCPFAIAVRVWVSQACGSTLFNLQVSIIEARIAQF